MGNQPDKKNLENLPQTMAVSQQRFITLAIHDLSGLSILRQAIQEEFKTGQDTLLDTFTHHFRGTADRILTLPTEGQILWFQLITLARKTTNTDSNFNIFSVNGVLQQWIKLPPKR